MKRQDIEIRHHRRHHHCHPKTKNPPNKKTVYFDVTMLGRKGELEKTGTSKGDDTSRTVGLVLCLLKTIASEIYNPLKSYCRSLECSSMSLLSLASSYKKLIKTLIKYLI